MILTFILFNVTSQTMQSVANFMLTNSDTSKVNYLHAQNFTNMTLTEAYTNVTCNSRQSSSPVDISDRESSTEIYLNCSTNTSSTQKISNQSLAFHPHRINSLLPNVNEIFRLSIDPTARLLLELGVLLIIFGYISDAIIYLLLQKSMRQWWRRKLRGRESTSWRLPTIYSNKFTSPATSSYSVSTIYDNREK